MNQVGRTREMTNLLYLLTKNTSVLLSGKDPLSPSQTLLYEYTLEQLPIGEVDPLPLGLPYPTPATPEDEERNEI